jgi:hypothetical protein
MASCWWASISCIAFSVSKLNYLLFLIGGVTVEKKERVLFCQCCPARGCMHCHLSSGLLIATAPSLLPNRSYGLSQVSYDRFAVKYLNEQEN